jgi:hypothetical protein
MMVINVIKYTARLGKFSQIWGLIGARRAVCWRGLPGHTGTLASRDDATKNKNDKKKSGIFIIYHPDFEYCFMSKIAWVKN